MKKESKIKKLYEKGLTQTEIAKKLKIGRYMVHYYLNREKRIQYMMNYFRNLPKEKRQEIYQKRKHYLKEYQKKRYNSDKEFREKQIERMKEYYKLKRKGK